MILRRAQQSELITGLEIGSTAIRLAVGHMVRGMNGKEDLQIIGMGEVPSDGVHRGVVSSIEETVSSLSNGLEQIERLIGVPIEHAWIGISGIHIFAEECKGVVAVAKADGEISEEDVDRAIDAARTVAVPLNYEILHVLPRRFNVDGQTGIKDPVGMTGTRLEADAHIIYGVAAHMKNITKAVHRAGLDIDDLVLSILSAGEVVVTSRQKDLGVAVVNIGGSTTSMVVYEEGDILHTAVLPLGSEHITNDIAIGLRTSIDIAERVKIQMGTCLLDAVSKKEKINLAEYGATDEEIVSRAYLAEIIEARVTELMEKVDEQLARIGRRARLPAGVVFLGGGAKIHGLRDVGKQILGVSASLGYPLFITSGQPRVNDIGFTSTVGLVRWGAEMRRRGVQPGHGPFGNVGKVIDKVQHFLKSLMP